MIWQRSWPSRKIQAEANPAPLATMIVNLLESTRLWQRGLSLGGAILLGSLFNTALAEEKQDETASQAINVEDTSTWLGFLKVRLRIGSLVAVDGKLEVKYAIDVPLLRSKSETGIISLELDLPLADLLSRGGRLRGLGHCDQQGKAPRLISCLVIPDAQPKLDRGVIKLSIVADRKTLRFASRYHVDQESSAEPAQVECS